MDLIDHQNVLLPIGISFYTFHSISYLIDVYYNRAEPQKNILNMALYITLFTQLVAGPIIRYSVFAPQLFERKTDWDKFAKGVERFIIGLGKKVLIANTLARIADAGFSQDTEHMNIYLSWASSIAYTFQIYFDFSGYSDMAIGLSKMFGFDFPENFNFPYLAKSIKEFWTRWHISLSSFFKDYVYIPLGGNKVGIKRTYINLLVVFILTGFWHGANFTFLLWGLMHGFFIVIERIGFEKILSKLPSFLRIFYAFFIVMLAWIAFKSNNIAEAKLFYQSLFVSTNSANINIVASYFSTDMIVFSVLAIVFSFVDFRKLPMPKGLILQNVFGRTKTIWLLAVFAFSLIYLISSTFNPFIYYQF